MTGRWLGCFTPRTLRRTNILGVVVVFVVFITGSFIALRILGPASSAHSTPALVGKLFALRSRQAIGLTRKDNKKKRN